MTSISCSSGPGATTFLSASAATSSASDTSTSPSMPFRFMDLPLELRLQVYEYLVVVGKVFYTPDEYSIANSVRFASYESYCPPSLAILRVCRVTHQEAKDVYLTRNLFVLPSRFWTGKPFGSHPDGITRAPFSEEAKRKIKHISVEITSRFARDTPVLDHSFWERTISPFDQSDQQEKMHRAHILAMHKYRVVNMNMIHHLQNMEALTTIELDFTNAFCPFGCCRDIEVTFSGTTALLVRMQGIRVLGMRDEREEADFVDSWSDMTGPDLEDDEPLDELFSGPRVSVEELTERHKVMFGVEGDPWEQWKTQDSR